MTVFKYHLLTFAFIFVLNSSLAFASSGSNQKIDMGALGPSTPQTAKKVERVYEQMTYAALTKLAWSYGAYRAGNSEDLNAYIIITECNLYNKFFSNEFEWEKIRGVTKEFLEKNKDKVSRYYEYVQPVILERYDSSLQGFPIVDADKNLLGQKNLQFANFRYGLTPCGGYDLGDGNYPSTAVLALSSPLTLTFVRVPKELAQRYLGWRESQGIATSDKRQAYIRYRIRIDGYEGIKSFEGMNSFSFRGKLMRLDVFADQEMMLPLYNQLF
jgi:hypothetical protein